MNPSFRAALRVSVCAALLLGVGLAHAAPPEAGSAAPDFTLPDVAGEDRTLSEQTGAGPVVLVFFRGAW